MCGICGIVDVTGKRQPDAAIVHRMMTAIRHRGPDGDGFYAESACAMGMRRLSIIDVAGSEQPLYNEDRSIALVFNGEIYNYRELRADLPPRGHRLATEGDGETIIHLYEEYGADLFRQLRGMYAFALWDANAARLMLAVDHIGMKPLYIHESDGWLRFASEIKALFADPAVTADLNLDVLDTYLSFGYPLGEETLFAGIRRLPPGHALIVENGETHLHPYWSVRDGYGERRPTLNAPDEEVIATVRRQLIQSVDIHLRSDVPLGLFLSGGIDSAAVLGVMAHKAGGRIKTYTVGYAGELPDNELGQARRVAGHFGTEHHERVITAEDWWTGFERYVYDHDEPNANPSAVSLLLLAEDTARDVKVVLTGLGGDELFGGYPFHRAAPALIRRDWGSALAPLRGPLAWIERYYPAFRRYRIIGALPTYLPRWRQAALPREEGLRRMQSFDGMVFSDYLREQLYGPELTAAWERARHKERVYAEILESSWNGDPYNTAQALVMNTWLTGNALLSQDKVTMAHSLEARVPFFDPAMMALAESVPPSLRMRANKYVLREAAHPFVPDFALRRPKQPFSTPIRAWFARDLSGRIRDVLFDPAAVTRRLLHQRALDRLLQNHFDGREKHDDVVLRLLTFELWHRCFIGDTARAPIP